MSEMILFPICLQFCSEKTAQVLSSKTGGQLYLENLGLLISRARILGQMPFRQFFRPCFQGKL